MAIIEACPGFTYDTETNAVMEGGVVIFHSGIIRDDRELRSLREGWVHGLREGEKVGRERQSALIAKALGLGSPDTPKGED